MRLSKHTDYALRVLMYLADGEGKSATTQQIARFHKISLNHLVKVVHNLSQAGFLKVRKGRNGGIWLAKSPDQINLREVVELCEPDFRMAECFPPRPGKCVILRRCRLTSALSKATQDFLEHLGQYNLSNLTPENTERK
jgi:Rrf2 family nitric oxide-sensitive transcriptional repressor